MRDFWNSRFSGNEYVYGEEPNTFFAEELQKYQPGALYLPGEGEGRNAVFAAVKGWKPVAVDWSAAGKEKAEKLAQKNETSITYHIADLTTYQPEPQSFDAAALLFVHLPPAERELLHRSVIEALKPGGVIILEAFTTEQLKYKTGGPRNEELLYDLEDIVEDFISLDFLHLKKTITELNEGEHHKGEASVLRFAGIKE